ncbi:hypothetical protein D3C78_1503460 [compost metagenome]
MRRSFPRIEKTAAEHSRLCVNVPEGLAQQQCFKNAHTGSEQRVRQGPTVTLPLDEHILSIPIHQVQATQGILRVSLHVGMRPAKHLPLCGAQSAENTKAIALVLLHTDAATSLVSWQQLVQNFRRIVG